MCENLTWSNYDRNPVLPVLWKCSKMHFLSLIFDMERSRLAKLWIRNNLEFMEWTIQNCPQMLFYVTCRHFYRPLKSCDIRFGMEEVKNKPALFGPGSCAIWKFPFFYAHSKGVSFLKEKGIFLDKNKATCSDRNPRLLCLQSMGDSQTQYVQEH